MVRRLADSVRATEPELRPATPTGLMAPVRRLSGSGCKEEGKTRAARVEPAAKKNENAGMTKFKTWVRAAGMACAMAFNVTPASALEVPQGPVILTLGGKIGVKNTPTQAQFDARMIDALPQHSFTTWTPWFAGKVTFTGPLLRDVLNAVKASGVKLKAVALNDYKIEIPVEDAFLYPVLLAQKIDGRLIPVREKGPLFVIYPFDSEPQLKASTYYGRSIWQLKSLHVE